MQTPPAFATLSELLEVGRAGAPALAEPGGAQLTYGALRATVDGFARGLRALGVRPGQTVALAIPNGIGIVTAFLGIARAGAIAAPLNPAYTRDEYAFYLEDIAPVLLLVPPGGGDAARAAARGLNIPLADLSADAGGRVRATDRSYDGALEQPRPDDVALFLHTSGTTSRPKGVPLRHENLCASASNIARWYRLTADDVSLCVMPLFHIHGIVFSTLAFLGVGGAAVVPPKFSAGAFWPTVAAERATVVSAVPTIYRTLLLRADEDGAPRAGEHGLRFLRSSSSALPAAEFHKLEARFGVPVHRGVLDDRGGAPDVRQPAPPASAAPARSGSARCVDVAVMDDAGALLPPGRRRRGRGPGAATSCAATTTTRPPMPPRSATAGFAPATAASSISAATSRWSGASRS